MADPPSAPEPRPDVPLPPGFGPPGPAPAGSADDHAHAHPDHDDSHEPLPRRLLAGLVAEAEETRERRGALVVALLSIGLGLLALGLPTEMLVHPGPQWVERMARGRGPFPAVLPGYLALGLHEALGLSIERGAFLAAALAFALTPAAAFVAAGRLGLHGGARIAAAFVVATAPSAWLAATLPAPFAARILGATILFSTLVDPTTRSRPERGLRVLTAALVATALDTTLGVLCPLVFLFFFAPTGATHPYRWRRRKRRLAAPALAALLAFVPLDLAAVQAGPIDVGCLVFLGVGFEDPLPIGQPSSAARAGALLLGAGVLPWLLLALARHRPAEGESRAPRWWRLWLALGLGGELLWRPHVPWTSLLPLALLGLAARAARSSSAGLRRELAVLLAIQVVLSGALAVRWPRDDELTTWRGRAVARLEPTDVVLTTDPRARYLLERRWGLEAIDTHDFGHALDRPNTRRWDELEERLAAAAARGRRIVVTRESWLGSKERDRLRERLDLTDL